LEWSNRRWPTYIRSFYGYVEITEHQIGFRLTRWAIRTVPDRVMVSSRSLVLALMRPNR
jgi:hypothetical protein